MEWNQLSEIQRINWVELNQNQAKQTAWIELEWIEKKAIWIDGQTKETSVAWQNRCLRAASLLLRKDIVRMRRVVCELDILSCFVCRNNIYNIYNNYLI